MTLLSHLQVWSIANIFTAVRSPERPASDAEENGPAFPPPNAGPPAPAGPTSWLYINVIATESQASAVHSARCSAVQWGMPGAIRMHGWLGAFTQGGPSAASFLPPNHPPCPQPWPPPRPWPPAQIFLPVFDAALAQHMALQLWDFQASLNRSEFERVMDLALACMLLDQVDDRGESPGQKVFWGLLLFPLLCVVQCSTECSACCGLLGPGRLLGQAGMTGVSGSCASLGLDPASSLRLASSPDPLLLSNRPTAAA